MAVNKIHIATLGKAVDPILRGAYILNASELYILTSEAYAERSREDSITKIIDGLAAFPIKVHYEFDGKPLLIDPFQKDSFERIIEFIIDIIVSRKGEDADFWVNITGGTNLMTAAATMAANLTQSTAYYVLRSDEKSHENEIIEVPPHNLMPGISDRRKNIFLILSQSRELSDSQIYDRIRSEFEPGITERQVRYPLEKLEKDGYINRKREGRQNKNSLTIWGRIIVKLLGLSG